MPSDVGELFLHHADLAAFEHHLNLALGEVVLGHEGFVLRRVVDFDLVPVLHLLAQIAELQRVALIDGFVVRVVRERQRQDAEVGEVLPVNPREALDDLDTRAEPAGSRLEPCP